MLRKDELFEACAEVYFELRVVTSAFDKVITDKSIDGDGAKERMLGAKYILEGDMEKLQKLADALNDCPCADECEGVA